MCRSTSRPAGEGIDAVARGYRDHNQLAGEELERLTGVLDMRPLWLACLDYRESVRSGSTPTMDEGWIAWLARPEHAERLTARAIPSLRG